MDKKEKIFEIVNDWYNKFSTEEIWHFWAFIILLSIIIDYIQNKYCCIALFSFEISNIIAIIVVIWAFTVSFGSYWLEKLDKSFYGTRMSDILANDNENKRFKILIFSILIELIVLVIAAIGSLKLTLIFLTMFQIFTMMYMVLVVCVKTSRENVIQIIHNESDEFIKQKKKDIPPVLCNMIQNLEYSLDSEREKLLEILKKIGNCDNKEIQWENKSVSKITKLILRSGEEDKVRNLLCNWYDLDSASIGIKQGIFIALIDELTPDKYSICEELLNIDKTTDKMDMDIWFIVYNIFISGNVGQEWRINLINRRLERHHYIYTKEGQALSMQYWEQIGNYLEDTKNMDSLFSIIFKYN